jgi:predicted DNA-binding transcriptional regulator AlpA
MSTQFALPRFLCTKKAAQLTGLSVRTLEKHRIFGTGPRYSKVGGRVLYTTSDVMEWIELGAKRSTSEPDAILPAKPIDCVKPVKQVPDSAIVVDVEAAGPAIMGTPEAARFLNLSVHTLAKHRTYGTGPKYRKVGRRILYAESDLTEWAERGTRHSTSAPETVLPAKPTDRVTRVKPVPDSAIVIELEAAGTTRLVDEVNLVEPALNSASAVELEAVGIAKPVDEVNVVEPAPDNAIVEVEAAEAAKLGPPEAILGSSVRTLARHFVYGTAPKYKLPSIWMMPSATSTSHGRKSASCSSRRRPPTADPAWVAPIPAVWPAPQAPGSSRISTRLERFPVISKRFRRRHGRACPGDPDNCWERRDKPGDCWLRYDAKRRETAFVDRGVR